jgi:hypothetical protein
MANIKLGAIITDIAGSVGGSTFRRTPAGIILYNKQGTQIKSAFAKNSVKNKLGAILSAWNFLTSEEKDFYIDKATLYTFPNKFGTMRNLTGRQFYTKLNAQMLPSRSNVSTSPWYDENYAGFLDSINASFGSEQVEFYFTADLTDYILLVQIYPLRSGANSKPSKRSVCTYAEIMGAVSSVNLWSEFVTQYPNANTGTTWGANIIFMTQSGFQTSVTSTTFVLSI